MMTSHATSAPGATKAARQGRLTVVIVLVNVELDLATRVGVAKTELRALHVALLETLEQLGGVKADATQKIGGDVGRVAGLALDAGELGLDRTSQVLVGKADDQLALLGNGEVQLEGGLEVVGHNAFANQVDVLEGVGGVSARGGSAWRRAIQGARSIRRWRERLD